MNFRARMKNSRLANVGLSSVCTYAARRRQLAPWVLYKVPSGSVFRNLYDGNWDCNVTIRVTSPWYNV
jgi:hypothetical protein